MREEGWSGACRRRLEGWSGRASDVLVTFDGVGGGLTPHGLTCGVWGGAGDAGREVAAGSGEAERSAGRAALLLEEVGKEAGKEECLAEGKRTGEGTLLYALFGGKGKYGRGNEG